jgi:hypothetical protein
MLVARPGVRWKQAEQHRLRLVDAAQLAQRIGPHEPSRLIFGMPPREVFAVAYHQVPLLLRCSPTLETRKRPNGQIEEHCHLWPIGDAAPGAHTATAVVRVLATGAEVTRTIEFKLLD